MRGYAWMSAWAVVIGGFGLASASRGDCPGRWIAAPGGPVGTSYAITTLADGDALVAASGSSAGATIELVRFSARTGAWTVVHAPGIPSGPVNAIKALANGDVVIGTVGQRLGTSGIAGAWRYSAASGTWVGIEAYGTGEDIEVDGAGGLVIAGTFRRLPEAGVTVGGGVAGQTLWTPFAQTVTAPYSATGNRAAVLSNGDVVFGGAFQALQSPTIMNLARYSTALGQWSALGSGVNGQVTALDVDSNGDLLVGGAFATAGGVPVQYAARWQAQGAGTWSALGTGLGGVGNTAIVRKFVRLPNGDLVAVGRFVRAGATVGVMRLAAGSNVWTPLDGGLNGEVLDLTLLGNGDLLVSGTFQTVNGVPTRQARYRLAGACAADRDCDGFVQPGDLFTYLNAWFGGDASADVDGTSGVTVDDLMAYVGLWFAGC